ncbi:aminotransferase class V-fold PLP-dependent enzyme [Georgenia sp. EYE_87]|uniref:pyridoxal phosphate-dependent decarboxylase family protein n=1 Tax=Georgenia sp. EYE_87 TaxID=2853448 RepID=UPI002005D5AC|nr:aminotransferase class V-fold PLP-dependent enzyme [Georgenia sp. EYE_87]MCK6209108.1 aminotransferase class V-fold PLP-dependent enzyme [Georgenia sp. EYE_87]
MDPGRDDALDHAHEHARRWLESLPDRPVAPRAGADAVADALGRELPDGPSDPAQVVDLLARACEPGLTAMPSGRFFGFVIGGTHPAGLAADWLVSAWDQNACLRQVTPAAAAVEEVAGSWLLDLLGLPAGSAVGFVTGATTANVTGLLAARDALLRRAGWDSARGLHGGPAVRVLGGAERHASVDLALRYIGLGTPEAVGVDRQGRMRPDLLRQALAARPGRAAIVVLQAGNIHSGDSDPFEECIAVAHEAGAWVHVDGAFGLWAAAAPRRRHLTAGVAAADSWATDAHKTLNVPYDSGLAIVRDADAMRAAMAGHGAYLVEDVAGDPQERVPELSRRARGVPVWAVLRALGRAGVADLVERLCTHARTFADGAAELDGVEVLNDVVLTQVSLAVGDEERTRRVVEHLLQDGTTWMTGSRWHDRAIVRVSVSNFSTTEDDVARGLDALARALAASR